MNQLSLSDLDAYFNFDYMGFGLFTLILAQHTSYNILSLEMLSFTK